MVMADVALQVWLDTQTGSGPAMVIPYVQSATAKTVLYRVDVIKTGAGSASHASQAGTVIAPAATPTALPRLTIDAGATDKCRIELAVGERKTAMEKHVFDCPRRMHRDR